MAWSLYRWVEIIYSGVGVYIYCVKFIQMTWSLYKGDGVYIDSVEFIQRGQSLYG